MAQYIPEEDLPPNDDSDDSPNESKSPAVLISKEIDDLIIDTNVQDASILKIFSSTLNFDSEFNAYESAKCTKDLVTENIITEKDGKNFISFIGTLHPDDASFNKICLDILTGIEFTYSSFQLQLPQYLKCRNTCFSETFASANEKEIAIDYLRWATALRTKVKQSSADIPQGILPKGISAELVDVRVNVRWGPDDSVYEKNPILREKVARGNCFIRFIGNRQMNNCCVVRGLKKFSGGYWDDDDVQHLDHKGWTVYFSAAPNTAKQLVNTEKVNGEAGHMSVRLLKDNFLIFAGSKNVHLAFFKREHLSKYTDSRYNVAIIVAYSICNTLEQMTEPQRIKLLAFMAHTGYSAMFELLQPTSQHIVNLSHLKEPTLKFIAWIPCDLTYNASLCSIPPHYGLELAQYLGLDTIHYSVVGMDQLEEELTRVRAEMQTEGSVIYFMGANGEVIGLLKYKSIWYILLRAIRERLKYMIRQILQKKVNKTKAIQEWSGQSTKKVNFICNSFKLTPSVSAQWKDLLKDFYIWVIEETVKGRLCDFNSMFPKAWTQFLEVSKKKEPLLLINQ